ncbi:MAG TPA: hypothetical protein VK856_03305 [Anaerolineaceae bacterium]|nr:hypothetical protein [Anaerolineaceae bacterium]
MSIGANLVLNIPYETSLAAHQIYNNDHLYLQIGDNLENIFNKIDILLLDPSSEMESDIVFRLALAGAFQFAESLSDSNASSATMKRMDWKYALFLPISHPGISIKSLCNFRQSLCFSSKALQEFGVLLKILGDFGLFSPSSQPWLDPKVTVTIICQTNRVFSVLDGMKSALSLVVSIAPEWLIEQVSPHWYERYKTGPLRSLNFSHTAEIQTFADQVGSDIFTLLTALKKANAPDLNTKAEIRHLQLLFLEQYLQNGDIIEWRTSGCANCLCNHLMVEGGHL